MVYWEADQSVLVSVAPGDTALTIGRLVLRALAARGVDRIDGPGAWRSGERAPTEKPVCDVCGEEDRDERVFGKVEICRSCYASAEHAVDLLQPELAALRASLAAMVEALRHEGAQGDGIHERHWSAYRDALMLLGWEIASEEDLHIFGELRTANAPTREAK